MRKIKIRILPFEENTDPDQILEKNLDLGLDPRFLDITILTLISVADPNPTL